MRCARVAAPWPETFRLNILKSTTTNSVNGFTRCSCRYIREKGYWRFELFILLGVYLTCASSIAPLDRYHQLRHSPVGKVLRLYCIGRVFESRGALITFYLFLFTSFSKSFFIVLFATYSVNVNFRDYSYMLTVWILYFHAIMVLPHTHDTGRGTGTLCNKRSK